jgi:hypothetical protein
MDLSHLTLATSLVHDVGGLRSGAVDPVPSLRIQQPIEDCVADVAHIRFVESVPVIAKLHVTDMIQFGTSTIIDFEDKTCIA